MSIAALAYDDVQTADPAAARDPDSLEKRLRQQTGVTADQASPAENCLLPLLNALKWDGLERHLFEALPHLEPISTSYELRSVLTRLNYQTTGTRKSLTDLTAEQFPCLLATPSARGRRRTAGYGPTAAVSGRNSRYRQASGKTATCF